MDAGSEREELAEQNRVLRARVSQLERAVAEGTDPILRSLAEHAASDLNVVDIEGRFLATGRTSAAFGSVIGRQVFDFVEPQYVPIMRAAFAQVVATGRPLSFENAGLGEDGSPGHVYLTRVVPLQEENHVKALVLIPTDITERVRLERSLREQEQALRLTIDASRMGTWSWGIATNQISWDDRVKEIFGVASAPANYATYLALLHPDDRTRVDGFVRTALETGSFPTFEHRVAARPGYAERWLLSAGSLVRDERGEPVRLMGGVLDITEQKHMATRLERAERVEHIGQLTAGIAHNFNNLLAAVIPNLEVALADARTPQPAHLQAALDASLQARDVVRSLMALTSRPDQRDLCPARPTELIPRVLDLCRLTFPRELVLTSEIDPAIGPLKLPAAELEQILLNLLFNARDAVLEAGERRREIAVEATRLTQAPEQLVEIRVRDTGVGMTESVRAQVFDVFFTTKPPHKGSGLGLAYAADRLREAGGSITCESRLGDGSTFVVRIAESDLPEPPPTTVSTHDQVQHGIILLVDDEPMVRQIVRQLLERDAHQVLEAESAAAARRVLVQEGARVDLVILDQSMPGERGLEALPSLQALTRAPFVLFTGLATTLPEGIAAVLQKPARPSELHRVVRAMLRTPSG